MGQYEPRDSRDVTNKPGREPGGIERTGPREGETRKGGKGDDDRIETPPVTSWEGERTRGTRDEGKRW